MESTHFNVVEAIIDLEGVVHFKEQIQLKSPQRVLVTFLEDAEPTSIVEGNVALVLALLNTPEFRNCPLGSAAELEATVKQNCDAWHD